MFIKNTQFLITFAHNFYYIKIYGNVYKKYTIFNNIRTQFLITFAHNVYYIKIYGNVYKKYTIFNNIRTQCLLYKLNRFT